MPIDDYAGTTSTTGRLNVGGTSSGSIETAGDRDWFAVTLTGGTAYTFRQNASASGLDSYLRLVSSSGTVLAENDDAVGTYNSQFTYTPTTSGTYYVAAGGYSASTGAYAVSVSGSTATPTPPTPPTTPTPGDDYASTTSTTGRLNVGGTSSGSIETGGDRDWFAVTLSGETAYTFRQNASTAGFDSYLRLVSSSGSVLAENDDAAGGGYNSLFTYTPTASGTYYVAAGGYGSSIGAYAVSVSGSTATPTSPTTPTTPTTPTLTSAPALTVADIFRAQGRIDSDGTTAGIFIAGEIRVMADFSKAAYALQTWETASPYGRKINDTSPNADSAHTDVLAAGWRALDLPIQSTRTTFGNGDYLDNQMGNGYYTNGNAAAFVARSVDSIVIAFRGTNDNGVLRGTDTLTTNSIAGPANDPHNQYRPDVLQWGALDDVRLEHNELPIASVSDNSDMYDHYGFFDGLTTALRAFVDDRLNGINHVYVTGHSLGGAMAIEFMSRNLGSIFEAVTFAAPTFTEGNANTKPYAGDTRIVQIEIDEDPVPALWTSAVQNRPGKQIIFYGDQTGDEPDWHSPLGRFNDDNHSMDYYRQITKSVDNSGWLKISQQPGDTTVFIGASSGPFISTNPTLGPYQADTYYIVDGRASGTQVPGQPSSTVNAVVNDGGNSLTYVSNSNYSNIYYGGRGSDVLAGSEIFTVDEIFLGGSGDDLIRGGLGADQLFGEADNDFLDGGSGDDVLNGGDGADTLVGGLGADMLTGGNGADIFKFLEPNEGRDVITDFLSGTDSLQFVLSGFITPGQSVYFVSGQNPIPNSADPTFLYDTTTGALVFDRNGNAFVDSLGQTLVVTLIGHPTLLAADLAFVST